MKLIFFVGANPATGARQLSAAYRFASAAAGAALAAEVRPRRRARPGGGRGRRRGRGLHQAPARHRPLAPGGPSKNEAILQIRGASKTFGSGRRRVTALDGVSLAVGEGEIVALVGESGSGKSTLGRAVVGLERLDAGELVFEGTEYARMRERPLRRLRRRMHLVLQDPYQSLHPGMRVAAAVAEPLEIAGTGDARSPVSPRPSRRSAWHPPRSSSAATRTSCPEASASGWCWPERW